MQKRWSFQLVVLDQLNTHIEKEKLYSKSIPDRLYIKTQ